jgi:acyl-CoA thioesterase II
VSDFDELMAVLDLHQKGDDVFVGTHPSKNPPRTFGGLMMAQSFVAAARSRTRDLPPNSLSAHFINGGDIDKDIEFHVVRLRDERRFANRRVEVTQDGTLLATVMISYLAGGRGSSTTSSPPKSPTRRRCRRSRSSCVATRRPFHTLSTHYNRSNGVTPTTPPG